MTATKTEPTKIGRLRSFIMSPRRVILTAAVIGGVVYGCIQSRQYREQQQFRDYRAKIHAIDERFRRVGASLDALSDDFWIVQLPAKSFDPFPNNDFDDMALRSILPELEIPKSLYLNLSNSKVDDASLARIAKLQNVESLALQRCDRISDAGVEKLDALSRLTILDLSDTRTTGAAIGKLTDLHRLETLVLRGLPPAARGPGQYAPTVTRRQVQELVDSLPQLTVYYCNALGGYETLAGTAAAKEP